MRPLRYVYARMNAWQENGFCLAAQAANGKQALEQLDKERFDLIVTDIRMPFVDGLELLRELRRRAIQTPVILVSSYGEFEYAREGLVLGAFDYIVKPFCEEQLNAVLSRAAQSLSAHTARTASTRSCAKPWSSLAFRCRRTALCIHWRHFWRHT